MVIEVFHAKYTLAQKRLKTIISSDEAVMRSQKYAKRGIRCQDSISDEDIWEGDNEPLGDVRTQKVNDVGTAIHEWRIESGGKQNIQGGITPRCV